MHTDVERALASPTSITPTVAADGVDEYLDVFVRTRGKQTLTGPLRITASDQQRSWTIVPSAREGRIDVDAGASDAAAELAGPSFELLLVLWGRITISGSDIAVSGDQAVAASFRS